VKSFQTALQRLPKLDRFEDGKIFFASRKNGLAFIVPELQFGSSLLKNWPMRLKTISAKIYICTYICK
jgi:hypothetical protein